MTFIFFESCVVPNRAIAGDAGKYMEYMKHSTQMKLYEGLFNLLIQNKPRIFTVSIEENEYPAPHSPYYPEPDTIYEIRAEVRAVETHEIHMLESHYDEMDWRSLSLSAIEEIKSRVEKWWRHR